jgi:hypothetical protein
MRAPGPSNRRARRRARRLAQRERKGVLAALTTSALLLPGLARAQEARWGIDYQFSVYSEDELDSSKLQAGDKERYEIDTHQLQMRAPLGGRIDLGFDLVHETMSGATPWYVEQNAQGEVVQVMTGASVEDSRTDFLGRGTYLFDTARMTLSGGYSVEDDYRAVNGGIGFEHDFNEKNTTLSWGTGISLDEIDPTDTVTNPNPAQEDKRSISVFAGISQVINRSSAFQTTFTYMNGDGFLSDPYKLVSVGGVNLADSRPDSRNQFAWLTRYRRHFSGVRGTLHADYRLYVDDWDVTSHTLELAWYQMLWDALAVVPSVRYYTQSQAEFYGPYFTTSPGEHASSDYRLSPYGALAWKLRAETRLSDWPFRMAWKVGVSWERYISDGDLAIRSVEVENPGLVSFNVLMFNLSARF